MRAIDHQCRRTGCIQYFCLCIDQPEHGGHIDHALMYRAINHAQHIQRAEQLGQIGVHKHQIARCQLALAPTPYGIGHGPAHQQVHDQ